MAAKKLVHVRVPLSDTHGPPSDRTVTLVGELVDDATAPTADAMPAAEAADELESVRRRLQGAAKRKTIDAIDMAVKRLRSEAKRGDGEKFCGSRGVRPSP